jgi:hypothetical protein
MFRVDEGRRSTGPLRFGDDVESQRGLPRRFRAVDLPLSAAGRAPVLSQNSIVVSVHRSGAGVKLSNLDLRGCRVAGNRAVPNDGHRVRLSFGTPRGGDDDSADPGDVWNCDGTGSATEITFLCSPGNCSGRLTRPD